MPRAPEGTDPLRGTGRTTRMCEEAIATANRESHAFILASNAQVIRDILLAQGCEPVIGSLIYRTPQGATIRVTKFRDAVLGGRHIFTDHAFEEARPVASIASLVSALDAKAIDDCAWPEPPAPASLPAGWRRRYESHWSCSAYTIYYGPNASKYCEPGQERESFSVCQDGISFGYTDHHSGSREEWLALMTALYNDFEHFKACAEYAERMRARGEVAPGA